jgi:hypothetical protein
MIYSSLPHFENENAAKRSPFEEATWRTGTISRRMRNPMWRMRNHEEAECDAEEASWALKEFFQSIRRGQCCEVGSAYTYFSDTLF